MPRKIELYKLVYIILIYNFFQDDLGIEYNRYLREVVETLEKDEEFKKKLETADEADIRVSVKIKY